MTDDSDEPLVPIVCDDCGTRSRIALPDVADAVARHNETRHDGEEVAEVDPALADRIADMAAADMGLLDGE